MPKHDHLRTLDIQTKYPEDLWRAINFAAKAHEGQKRKNVDEWYISHPFDVMGKTMRITDDTSVHIGAILHDTVEDTGVTLDDIEREFGAEAAFHVWGVTKDDTIPGWRPRNEAYLHRLEHKASTGSNIIALGDKASNIDSLIRDYKMIGEPMWKRFNAGPEDQLWWFTTVQGVIARRIGSSALYEDFGQSIETFKEEVLEPGLALSR